MEYSEGPQNEQKIIAENIKNLRVNSGFTQEQIANALHMNRSTYAYYELGRTIITIELLNRLAMIYKVPISSFWETEERKASKFADSGRNSELPAQVYNLSDVEKELCLKYRLMPGSDDRTNQPFITMIPATNQIKDYDIVVCGGGTSGLAAAIAAARQGARVLLVEKNNALGGTLTLSNVSYIMDLADKQGFSRELVERMQSEGAGVEIGRHAPVDQEYMRFLLEEMCEEAGVTLRYYTQVVGVSTNNKRVTAIQLFSKSGFEEVVAQAYIDATGDGDVCALAGCDFTMGNEDGECQPMSFNVVVSGVKVEDIKDYCIHVPGGGEENKKRLWKLLDSLGVQLSYTMPFFMPFPGEEDRFIFACHHQYSASAVSADDLTKATLDGRRECFRAVQALRSLGGVWKDLKIIQSPQSIGVRESRRISGKYTVTKYDLETGAEHDNTVCHVTFNVDVHCRNGYTTDGVEVKKSGYDIPLDALQARDFSNLFMTGRCISGDFYSHASYRVMGNTLEMGASLGTACGKRFRFGVDLAEIEKTDAANETEGKSLSQILSELSEESQNGFFDESEEDFEEMSIDDIEDQGIEAYWNAIEKYHPMDEE